MEVTKFLLLCTAIAQHLILVSSDGELIDKRRPGWGKRNVDNLVDDEDDYVEAEKRKPGWGKRSDIDSQMDKRKPGWGKRDFSEIGEIDKRKPGWGKRSMDDLNNIIKRRPGWGKRSGDLYDALQMYKRRPGWGKRSFPESLILDKRRPGWGKRSFVDIFDTAEDNDTSDINKRRPGWGKRSDIFSVERRRPGWGKRTPGWGKRSDLMDNCGLIDLEVERLLQEIQKIEEYRLQQCGTPSEDGITVPAYN